MISSALLLVAVSTGPLFAQRVSVPRHHNAWGRFSPDSWAKLRKVTEELDEDGNVKSVSTTETKTTLVGVDTTGCDLEVQVTVEIAGKQFNGPSKTIRVGYNGEGDGETATVRKTADGQLKIGGRSIACAVLEAKITAGEKQINCTMLYSDKVAPYILRRETRLMDDSGEQLKGHTVMETLAVDMPCNVLGEIKSASHVQTISTGPGRSTYTLEVVCPEIPGGIVSHTSKEMDETGRVVKRSTLELMGYRINDGAQTSTRGFTLFHRAKTRRASLSESQ